MNLIKKIKLLFKFKGLYKKIMEAKMSKGFKSTEFWLVVVGSLVTAFQALQGTLDPKIATIVGASLTCIYTIMRSLTKSSEAKANGKAPVK